ncbi:MAG: tetratricopeptide repeat protein [Cyanobacteria bacterium P01_D01_bin.105]
MPLAVCFSGKLSQLNLHSNDDLASWKFGEVVMNPWSKMIETSSVGLSRLVKLAILSLGLWLLFSKVSYAENVKSCRIFPSINSCEIMVDLPERSLGDLQMAYLSAGELTFQGSQSLQSSGFLGSSQGDHHIKGFSEGFDTEFWASAIRPDSSSSKAWNRLGQAFFRIERYEDALMAYDHALLIKPNYSLALANRCGTLSKLAHYNQALSSCNLALKGDGQWDEKDSALAWNNRGAALFKLKEYRASLHSFEQALMIRPDLKSVWRNRSVVLSLLKKRERRQRLNVSDRRHYA